MLELNFNLEALNNDLEMATRQLQTRPERVVFLPTNENDPADPLSPNARGKARVDAAVEYAVENDLRIVAAGGWHDPLGFSMAFKQVIDILLRHGVEACARVELISGVGVTTLQNIHAMADHWEATQWHIRRLEMATENAHYARMVPVAEARKIELGHIPSDGDTSIYGAKDDFSLELNKKDPYGENSIARAFTAQAELDWQKSSINNFYIWWMKDQDKANARLRELGPIFLAYLKFAARRGIMLEPATIVARFADLPSVCPELADMFGVYRALRQP